MALKDDIKILLEEYKAHESKLKHNAELFDIFEGNLEPYVMQDLAKQLSPGAYSQVIHRVAPINLLKRIIDKLSKIYAKPPVRKLEKENESDKKLLSFYEREIDINTVMGGSNGANGFFNLFKSVWVEPFLDLGKPNLRVLPAERFFVYSNDKVNPLRPTHFVKVMGKSVNAMGAEVTVFHAYTKDEFLPFDQEGNILNQVLIDLDNPAGVNGLGMLPGIYINRSKYNLIPKPDTDTLRLTKLVPVILSDLNFALMFQCFAIIYTINADQSSLKLGPNVLWDIKSDGKADAAPEVGSIKPDVDSDKALGALKALISMWMQSRNIKPGAMGDMTVENSASAIAKVVDEMDTSEDRKEQVPYFIEAERELWDLLMVMHEDWKGDPDFDTEIRSLTWTAGQHVDTNFAEQRPIVDSSKAIGDQKAMLEMNLQTPEGALRELYPDWTDAQIEKRMEEIAAYKTVKDAEVQKQREQLAMDAGGEQGDEEDTEGLPGMPKPKAKKEAVAV